MGTKVTVHTRPSTIVSINQNKVATIKTINLSGSGSNRLSQLIDVDMSEASNNETLVYNANSGQFAVQSLPIIDGGNF